MNEFRLLAAVTVLVGVAAVVVGGRLGPCFCLRGRYVTDDVIVRNGQMYVPVSALARALDLRVRDSGSTCDLVPEEAAAAYRFEVLSVERTGSYRAHFGTHDFSLEARPGRELIVVTCRLLNGTDRPQSIDLTGGRDTRLTDAAYRSVSPSTGYGRPLNGRAMVLARDGVDFALKFDVPQGFRPEGLVFSVQNTFDQSPLNFRVSLHAR